MTRREFYESLILDSVAGGGHTPCFEKWCPDNCRCD
jgi:hypothetical protein